MISFWCEKKIPSFQLVNDCLKQNRDIFLCEWMIKAVLRFSPVIWTDGCSSKQLDVFNGWVSMLFKRLDISTEWVIKSFEWLDVSTKRVIKPFERMQIFLTNDPGHSNECKFLSNGFQTVSKRKAINAHFRVKGQECDLLPNWNPGLLGLWAWCCRFVACANNFGFERLGRGPSSFSIKIKRGQNSISWCQIKIL